MQLGMRPQGTINMAVRLEQETGMTMKEEDLWSLRTVQNIVDVIHRKLQAEGVDRS